MKLIKILLLGLLLFSKPVTAAIDPCTIPCALPCFLTRFGGPVMAIEEIGQRIVKGTGETLKQGEYALQQVQGLARKLMSEIQKLRDIAAQLMSGDFNVLNDEEEKEPAVVQDTQVDKNASTITRVQRNVDKKYYGVELQAGYKGEYAFEQRRLYIRQQATLKYIARVMILKNKYEDIVKIVNKIEKEVDDTSKRASQSKNIAGMMERTEIMQENKTALIQQTAELKAAWAQLLLIQKQIEAARLEYQSNIGLSNMKPVKFIPVIKGAGTSGGSK